MVLAIGQDNAFPFIERDIGLEFGKWDMPVVDKTTFMSTRPGVFFGGDAAFGPANIIWAVEHGHQAAISIHNYCQGVPRHRAPRAGMTLTSTKMGLHEWALQQQLRPRAAPEDEARRPAAPLPEHDDRGGEGVHAGADHGEVERCLNCDIETHFTDSLCIECDACIDICPVDCLTDHAERRRAGAARQFARRRPTISISRCSSRAPLKQTGRVMAKDENVCLHCGLCAERCPTYAWDMRKFVCRFPTPARR